MGIVEETLSDARLRAKQAYALDQISDIGITSSHHHPPDSADPRMVLNQLVITTYTFSKFVSEICRSTDVMTTHFEVRLRASSHYCFDRSASSWLRREVKTVDSESMSNRVRNIIQR